MINSLPVPSRHHIRLMHDANSRMLPLQIPIQTLLMKISESKSLQVFQASPIRDPGCAVGVIYISGKQAASLANDFIGQQSASPYIREQELFRWGGLTAPLLPVIRQLFPHISKHIIDFQSGWIKASIRCTKISYQPPRSCSGLKMSSRIYLLVQLPSKNTTISLSHPFFGTDPSSFTICAVVRPMYTLSKLGSWRKLKRISIFLVTRPATVRKTGRATMR
jgi:hypothetical protein